MMLSLWHELIKHISQTSNTEAQALLVTYGGQVLLNQYKQFENMGLFTASVAQSDSAAKVDRSLII